MYISPQYLELLVSRRRHFIVLCLFRDQEHICVGIFLYFGVGGSERRRGNKPTSKHAQECTAKKVMKSSIRSYEPQRIISEITL